MHGFIHNFQHQNYVKLCHIMLHTTAGDPQFSEAEISH